MKPSLASRSITRGRVNASARKIDVGVLVLGPRAITHSQKANGLVCGLSTRKIRHAVRRSSSGRRPQRLPQSRASPRSRSRRVDVLVLLGRVLGVLDRAVGPVAEPLRVLGDPRVVGRALEREVERDLEAVLAAVVDEGAKSSIVPSSGWTAVWPPSGRRSPRGCRGRRAGVERVVRPLRYVVPIGMDRRQVEDVEAHVGDVGQLAW